MARNETLGAWWMLVAVAMSVALALLALLSVCLFGVRFGTVSEGAELFFWTAVWFALPIALVRGVIVGPILTAVLWHKPAAICVHALWWPAAALALATGWRMGPLTALVSGGLLIVVAIVLAVRIEDVGDVRIRD